MRFNRNRLLSLTAAAAFAVGGLPGILPARAQGSTQPAGGLLSVNFPGGTVADYIEALRASVQPANVALSESAAGALLPPVRLDKVSIGTALSAIEYIAPTANDETWVIATLGRGSQDEPLAYAVTLTRRFEPGGMMPAGPAGAVPPGRDRQLKVFSIKDLIDSGGGEAEQTVLSAVELALKMDEQPGQSAPDVRFHPESGLLILEAAPQQVAAVDELLNRIRSDTERQRDKQERLTRQQQEDELNVRLAAAKVQSLQDRMAFFQENVDRLKQLREAGTASDDDVRQAQATLMDTAGQYNMLMTELEGARVRQSAGPVTSGDGGDNSSQVTALRAQVNDLTNQVAALQAQIRHMQAKRK